ncbi:E3 ubiquitin-protein ligase TRIM33-like isoform X1 [Littorina saxatilis]|uniref:Uncharacterized protein n=1 Tax=Littorina saxatilis TaxID=31220 RepID=A0AAN9G4G6_9CAEN
METSALPVDPNEMQCSICHELFVEPKILPCGHLLCRQCLLSWLQSQAEAARCPLGRCSIIDEKDRRSGKSVVDIADSFLTDRAMAALVEAHRLLSEQHVCCVCVNVSAVSVCMDCGDTLCQKCTTLHNKQSATKHHAVHKLSSLTTQTLAAKSRSACAVHADTLPVKFCPAHRVSVCLHCATTAHRQCPDVRDVEERRGEARATLRELASTLAAQEAEVARGIGQADDQLTDIDRQTKASIAETDAIFDHLTSVINTHRRQVTGTILKTSSDKKAATQDRKNVLLNHRGKLILHKRFVERSEGVVTRDDVTALTSEMKPFVNGHVGSTSALLTPADVTRRLTVMREQEEMYNVTKALSALITIKDIPIADGDTSGPASFYFHDNHGTNIVLSNNHKTAERKGRGYRNGIVVSRYPIEVNKLYEICMDKADGPEGWYLPVGVVTSSPFSMTLPARSGFWDKAVVVWAGNVTDHGAQINNYIGREPLYNLRTGNRVGVSLDSDRQLHLHVNGQDKGVVSPCELPGTCYAIFDVWFEEGKISTLPVTSVI